uniref:CCHC-type domain-containing protein n=1 Tax=Haemonchus contortus TaxID=6289 RepID=W6NDX6_HAECO
MENLRRHLRDTEDELAHVRRELDQKTQELRDLRRALPLPNPEKLYHNIMDLCYEFHTCTTRTSDLDNRIKSLRHSANNNEIRLHDVSLLGLPLEKLRIEILFIRSQLRTLFTGSALLCAAKIITMDIWRTWMDRPHRNEGGNPLLVQPEKVETVASDQLQQLDRNRQVLVEIRASMMETDQQDTREFQNQMRTAMAKLQSSLDAALANLEHDRREAPLDLRQDNAMDDLEEAERAPIQADRASPRDSLLREGMAMHDQERGAIQENVEYLEELEEEEGEVGEEEEEPQEVEQERIRQQNAIARQEIEGDIRQLQQARTNFLQIIDELRRLPTCPPRRLGYGAVRSDTERFIRCAFCRASGKHYSGSCGEFPSVSVRRRMIEDRGKCVECLELCRRDESCKRYYDCCYHCGKYDHHSALCELPDRSDEIAEQLAHARRGLAQTTDRINQLERDLQRLQD